MCEYVIVVATITVVPVKVGRHRTCERKGRSGRSSVVCQSTLAPSGLEPPHATDSETKLAEGGWESIRVADTRRAGTRSDRE